MKNQIIFAITLLLTAEINSQNYVSMDTIYANEHKNVALFFPNPIRQGITGSENFIFTYNQEKENYFGLLQATPGSESNLLIINNNGAIFSYIVRYKEKLSKLNYFIPKSSSIGNERPSSTDSTNVSKLYSRLDGKEYYYQRFCSYLLNRKQTIGRHITRNDGIELSVENIVFDKDELYFVIQIENKSSLDYDLNFLNLSIMTRKKGKKKSLQNLYQEPLFVHNLPSKIKEKDVIKLVYILPKFSISNERMVILELNEKNGERNLSLKISHNSINNPN